MDKNYFNLETQDIRDLMISESNSKNGCYIHFKSNKSSFIQGFILDKNSRTIILCEVSFFKNKYTDRYIPRLTFRKTDTDFQQQVVSADKKIIISFNESQKASRFWNLINFLKNYKDLVDSGDFEKSYKVVSQDNIDDISVKKYLQDNPALLKNIIENEIAEDDLISLGYRKKQLDEFKKLLDNNDIQEADWQRFFEKNTWIFGYGLSYIFQTSLDDKKIEQVVHGYDFNSIGKRVDGLLKTAGMINSLCFVEIKTHKTDLLDKKPYRKGCWAISNELSGAVSQIQNTVSLATKNIYDKINIKDDNGNLTGEEIFNFHPKSFLIVGKLDEFTNEYGVNTDKYRSFELFRRNVFSPEIITFDELYERAKYIVSQNDKSMGKDNV